MELLHLSALKRVLQETNRILTYIDENSWCPSNLSNPLCFSLYIDKPRYIREQNDYIKALIIAIESHEYVDIVLLILEIMKNDFLIRTLQIEMDKIYKQKSINYLPIKYILQSVSNYTKSFNIYVPSNL